MSQLQLLWGIYNYKYFREFTKVITTMKAIKKNKRINLEWAERTNPTHALFVFTTAGCREEPHRSIRIESNFCYFNVTFNPGWTGCLYLDVILKKRLVFLTTLLDSSPFRKKPGLPFTIFIFPLLSCVRFFTKEKTLSSQ